MTTADHTLKARPVLHEIAGPSPIQFEVLLSRWEQFWLSIGLVPGVDFIPIEVIDSASAHAWIETLCALADGTEEGTSSHVLTMLSTAKILTETAKTPTMARLDCCSDGDLKYAMSRRCSDDVLRAKIASGLAIGDSRCIDILMDVASLYGTRVQVALMIRPWVNALKIGGYPVEFRVFAEMGSIQGVSSYYPQRDLPQWCEELAKQCEVMAHRLVRGGARDFTADYLIREQDGAPILLECGPPHIKGHQHSADPCCHRAGDVSGVALSRRW